MADASAIISVARTGCGEILLEQTGQAASFETWSSSHGHRPDAPYRTPVARNPGDFSDQAGKFRDAHLLAAADIDEVLVAFR